MISPPPIAFGELVRTLMVDVAVAVTARRRRVADDES